MEVKCNTLISVARRETPREKGAKGREGEKEEMSGRGGEEEWAERTIEESILKNEP